MHRDLPEGNTKLVLILFSALGPSDHGPGLRLLQQSFHLLEMSTEHRLMVRLQHRVLHATTLYS